MSDFVCRNCGKCCGPVAIVEEERKRIERFLKKHPSIRVKINKKGPSLDCVFRDEKKGCLIYSARPQICRAYTCVSKDWTRNFKMPQGPLKLINDCFGVGCSVETYKSMCNEYLNTIQRTP